MIREFTPDDIIYIEQIGRLINDNYKFKINPYMRCLVYDKEGTIIGFIVFSIMYENAEIIDIAVSTERQGEGIGTKLLEYVIHECVLNKCESVTLEVRNGNQKAISFYKKMGFRELMMRKSYYHDGEDALIMTKMVI